MSQLPPSFTSLYRIFLRASSASVLHTRPARRHLRKLFRPAFDAAAKAIRDLQGNELSPSQRTHREHLLNTFHERMDGTLSLLLNSAQYRGLPHKIILNLNQLRSLHSTWVNMRYYPGGSKHKWNPKISAKDREKAAFLEHQRTKRTLTNQRIKNNLHEEVWDALGEVVRMAEGRHNLSLGRVQLQRWALKDR